MAWTFTFARFRFPLTLLLGLRLLLTTVTARAQAAPAGQGLVADSTELRVLRQFYYATQGDGWANHTNWLTGTTVAEAASWYGVRVYAGDVAWLTLANNHLVGPLPAALGLLTQLHLVEADNNQLTGPLPASFGNWSQLQWLSLAHNQLTGSIPNRWGRLGEVVGLELSFNQLSGPLPDSLSACAQLLYLRLAVNQFTGPLPAAWGQFRHLNYLGLGHNSLSGPLPDELTQLHELGALGLESNQLSGPLPAHLEGLRALGSLDLSDNRFTGTLPESFGQLPLGYCTLGHNAFSGPLPASVGRLRNLQYLFLDVNRFSGALPDSLGQLPQLRGLNASGNLFSGTVPASLLRRPGLLLQLAGNHLSQLPDLGGATGLPVAALLPANELGFAALEQLYQGPQQPRLAYLELQEQRPPTQVDTVSYAAGGALVLQLRTPAAAHAYAYQWQRLVGGQWVNMPGDTLPTKNWVRATAAEQGTYRRAEHNRWFTDPRLGPTELYSSMVYADLLPYQPLAQNRPDDTNQGLGATTAPVDSAAWHTGAAPPDVNYVRVWSPRVALTDASRVPTAPVDSVAMSTQYLDGLGRPVQTVLKQASPARRDMVQPQAYDGLGREPRAYLPYPDSVGGRGGYRPQALRRQDGFYRPDPSPNPPRPDDPTLGVARTGAAYAETQFEASPLNRVTAQGAAGEAWQITAGHVVERVERPNTAADSVLWFVPSYDPKSLDPGYQGFYAPGELWGTDVSDAHGPTEPGEKGYRTLEWKDKLGQVVGKQVEANRMGTSRTGLHSRWLRTCYVYDDFGHLRFVLQPEASKRVLGLPLASTGATLVPASVQPFLFHYRYDGRGRQIAKQVPGQDGETLVIYDQLDRPVLSQDAAQRLRKEWSWTKYDALGRIILSGLVTRGDTLGQVSLQALATADTATSHQYEQRTADVAHYPHWLTTEQSFPKLGQQGFGAGQVLSVTRYDDYDYNNDGQADVSYDPSQDKQFPSGQAPVADALRTTGLVTQTKTRVLGVAENDATQAAWLTTTTFYDERARPVQVQATNARKGTDLLTTQLDFTGKVVQSIASHQGPSHTPVQVAEFFTYDHTGRLLSTRQQLLGVEARPALLDSVRYNEIGQVVRKILGTGRLRQDVDYAYNIRGWLTSVNDPYQPTKDDLFNLSLHYERGFTKGYEQYGGNLTGQTWRGRDGVQRAYGYVYDPLNRLLQGDFLARNTTTPATPIAGAWKAEEDNYRLAFVSYDDNGNILTLRRRGLLQAATAHQAKQYGAVDALTYAYQGNRLQAVDDAVTGNQLPRSKNYNGAPTSLAGDFQEAGVKLGQEYLYDANGNLTQDKNKGITGIAYNHLNLPRQIHFGQIGDSVVFRYTASGQKVAKLVYQTGKPVNRTDYLGAYQYEQDSLKFFPHAEGRVLRFVSGVSGAVAYQREYTIKDHLGNLRLAYRLGQVRTLTATLEQDQTTHKREAQQFDSLSVSPPVAVATSYIRTGAYAAKLNAGGSAPQPLGPLTQLGVQKGDSITVTAYGLYPQAQQHGLLFSLASFITNLLHPASSPPPALDGRKRQDLPLLQVGLSAGLASIPQLSGGVPQGYLRLLIFNRDSALVGQQVQQLTQVANGGYERLRLQVVLPQDGYVTAYVGSQSDVDVFFDDVQVEHRPGLQVQENQYDPWGLSLAGLDYSAPGIQGLNKYQFNGKERQLELGLGWSDYGARFYDPARGPVWMGVDLLADAVNSWSPYVFSMDNPVLYTDMTGMLPGLDSDAEVTAAPHKGFQPENPSHYIAQGVPGTKLPVVNGVAQAELPGVTVTGTSTGPAWASSVIRNYQSNDFFSTNPNVAPNAYGWTESEINNGLKYEVMAVATLFGGGAAIADIGAGALFEGGVVGFGTRATADVGIQTIAGRLSGQSWGNSLANVNLLESGMAGAGFNPMSMGTLTAGFGYSTGGGLTSSFTPSSSLTAFLGKSAIGTGFGWAGGMLANPRVTATIGLSVALRTGSGGLGVQVGLAATHAMEKSVGVAEEYYEGQMDKTYPAK